LLTPRKIKALELKTHSILFFIFLDRAKQTSDNRAGEDDDEAFLATEAEKSAVLPH
jgi:hypothetical protein